jgi:hypothetical protein
LICADEPIPALQLSENGQFFSQPAITEHLISCAPSAKLFIFKA